MECDNGLSESGTMDIVVTLPHTEARPSDGGVLVSLAGGQHDEELVDLRVLRVAARRVQVPL